MYAKPVTWPTPLPCPHGDNDWTWGASAHWKNKTVDLVAVPFQQGEGALVIAARTQQGLELLDAGPCDSGPLVVGKRGLLMETVCVTGRCTTMGHSSFRLEITAEGGSASLKSTKLEVIDRAQCD